MIYGFQHICTIGNWKDVVLEQQKKIYQSGLYEKAEKIFCGVVGPIDFQLSPEKSEKFEIVYSSENVEEYEFPTLAFMYDFCKKNLDAQIFYIHTKGVSNLGSRPRRDWRRVLEYFIIERFEDCLNELQKVDIVGINWREGPQRRITPHFSGNFWWARASHIAFLPNFLDETVRFNAEFWIGRSYALAAELFNTGVRHHAELYPEERYKDQDLHVKYYKIRDGRSQEVVL